MGKGLGAAVAGVFIGVFAGALAYELVRKTESGRRVSKKVVAGLRAAKDAFMEGYQQQADTPVAAPAAEA